MRIRIGLIAFGLGWIPAAAAQAPTPKLPKPLPVMRGVVQDTLGTPLEAAQIEILGLDRRVTTAASGTYRFDGIKPGKYWVAVRRIGYAPLHIALSFNQGEDREIAFQLQPSPQALPELEVRAEKMWAARYRDFVWRSHSAFGHFLTRDDIEKIHPAYLSDVVRRYLPFTTSEAFFTPALDPWGASRWRDGMGSSRAFPNRSCAPAVSLNGSRPLAGSWAVNDFRPEEVEAVEVYRNGFQMPIEFNGWDTQCGLVVIWTG